MPYQITEYKIKHRENRLEEIKMENNRSYKGNKTHEILDEAIQ